MWLLFGQFFIPWFYSIIWSHWVRLTSMVSVLWQLHQLGREITLTKLKVHEWDWSPLGRSQPCGHHDSQQLESIWSGRWGRLRGILRSSINWLKGLRRLQLYWLLCQGKFIITEILWCYEISYNYTTYKDTSCNYEIIQQCLQSRIS